MEYRVIYRPADNWWAIQARRCWPFRWKFVAVRNSRDDAITLAKQLADPETIYIKPTIAYY